MTFRLQKGYCQLIDGDICFIFRESIHNSLYFICIDLKFASVLDIFIIPMFRHNLETPKP